MKKLSRRLRQAIMSMHGDSLVRLYSFQASKAHLVAQERGYWAGSPDHIEEDWVPAYAWMRDQMAKRIEGFSGDYPIWAYLKRPNLRQVCYDSDRVLITALVPRKRILLSDYDTWHMCLNNFYLSLTEEEDNEYDRADPRGMNTQAKQKTWERIFDMLPPLNRDEKCWRSDGSLVQACIDRIYVNEVVSVRRVEGRTRRKHSFRNDTTEN